MTHTHIYMFITHTKVSQSNKHKQRWGRMIEAVVEAMVVEEEDNCGATLWMGVCSHFCRIPWCLMNMFVDTHARTHFLIRTVSLLLSRSRSRSIPFSLVSSVTRSVSPLLSLSLVLACVLSLSDPHMFLYSISRTETYAQTNTCVRVCLLCVRVCVCVYVSIHTCASLRVCVCTVWFEWARACIQRYHIWLIALLVCQQAPVRASSRFQWAGAGAAGGGGGGREKGREKGGEGGNNVASAASLQQLQIVNDRKIVLQIEKERKLDEAEFKFNEQARVRAAEQQRQVCDMWLDLWFFEQVIFAPVLCTNMSFTTFGGSCVHMCMCVCVCACVRTSLCTWVRDVCVCICVHVHPM